MLAEMPDATVESALPAFTFRLNKIAEPMRQTLTYDRGKEMARHRDLARSTNMRVYFCNPHSPWERCSCKNNRGLLRAVALLGLGFILLVLLAWMGATKVLKNIHQRVSGSGNRKLLTGHHQVPVGAVG
jgi:hypothetical protein